MDTKQLEADQVNTIVLHNLVGSKIKGKISSIADSCVFVDVEEDVKGLIHTSQLGLEKD